jgi:hypothetical protein
MGLGGPLFRSIGSEQMANRSKDESPSGTARPTFDRCRTGPGVPSPAQDDLIYSWESRLEIRVAWSIPSLP